MRQEIAEFVDRYTYRVQWSEKDQEFVATCAEFSFLSWLETTKAKALNGIVKLVGNTVEDRLRRDEEVPEPFAARKFSGAFKVRIPPDRHRQLVLEAAEQGVSLNRLVSDKLAQ